MSEEENYRIEIREVRLHGNNFQVLAIPQELVRNDDGEKRWCQLKGPSGRVWTAERPPRAFRIKWKDAGDLEFVRMQDGYAEFRPSDNPGTKSHIHAELREEETDVMAVQSEQLSLAELRQKAGIGAAQPFPHSPPRDLLPVRVQLTRTQSTSTHDMILSTAIRYSTESIKFSNYVRFIDYVLCGDNDKRPQPGDFLETDARRVFSVGDKGEAYDAARHHMREHKPGTRRLLSGTEGYRALREATDWFLKVHVGVLPSPSDFARIEADLVSRVGSGFPPTQDGPDPLTAAWNAYSVKVDRVRTLPYLKIIRAKLADVPIHTDRDQSIIECSGLIQEKLQSPCFIELIWSYWQEEGMLVQAINAVAQRFQNRRVSGPRDPLVNLEIDPLRPLNNILWGYVQDELSRLSVLRRAHEYEHHYGLRLEGLAVSKVRPADRRSKFLEAFHNFLQQCHIFYERDDQTTVVADGFPVLNAIKEVHYLLAQGAHNQFGDLPSTARAEMLIQQWLLARPEMREFLGGRTMVPYPEPWMDRVDAMKSIQGWTDTSVVHFNDLATFGEQIVLGLRYGAWSIQMDPAGAANFARDYRAQIQGYVHAYRAVTGVQINSPVTTQQSVAERNLPPSVHLMRRLAAVKRA